MKTLEARVQRLEDERDILGVLYTYGHAIDYNYEQEFLDCWTEDARLVYCALDQTHQGREAIARAFREHTHAPEAYHKHFLAEPRIRIDGDRATVESMYARLDRFADGPKVRSFGRYVDVLVRCADGRWRFKERLAQRETQHAQGAA